MTQTSDMALRSPFETVLGVVAALGAAAGTVAFIFWCEQSGFYGAFSVAPEQVGIEGSVAVQLSVGAAYVCFYLAAIVVVLWITITLVWKVIRAYGHHRRGRLGPAWRGWLRAERAQWANWTVAYAVLVALTLVLAISAQAFVDGREQPGRTMMLACCLLGLSSFLLAWRYARRNPQLRTTAVTLMVVVLVGISGVITNAWSYGIGTQLRDGEPSRATFIIGRTPPIAHVEWADSQAVPGTLLDLAGKRRLASSRPEGDDDPVPWASPDEFLLLGTANDQAVLFHRRSERVLLLALDDIHLVVTPHDG